MSGIRFAGLAGVCLTALALAAPAQAQQPPPITTTKVEGTDDVYIFRYDGASVAVHRHARPA